VATDSETKTAPNNDKRYNWCQKSDRRWIQHYKQFWSSLNKFSVSQEELKMDILVSAGQDKLAACQRKHKGKYMP
jgi:hypothetical protein